jgi:hypothetical protein
VKQHTAVVKATIESIPALATKTFVAVAPRVSGNLPTAPYVVIHAADGEDEQDRLAGPQSLYHPNFTLHIVGSSYENAQTVTELIKAKFVVAGFGVFLTVAGETTSRCRWAVPQPTQTDYSLGAPLIYNVAELAFDSQPL